MFIVALSINYTVVEVVEGTSLRTVFTKLMLSSLILRITFERLWTLKCLRRVLSGPKWPFPWRVCPQEARWRRRRVVGSTTGCGPTGSQGMAGVHLHQAAGHHQAQGRREAQVPVGGPRHPSWYLRRPHLQAGVQLGHDAVPAGRGQSPQGMQCIILVQVKIYK